jgi:DNA polymerase-1
MIHLDGRLREEGLQTRMILQVHDELLFEAPEEEVERAQALLKAAMETVEFPPGKAYSLKVPLVVELGRGPHWAALK